jgi:S1-C subfamily serine protease
MTRETRLLLATIVLSVVVVLALGTMRFPEERPAEAPPTPLERLAASATYEQLARSVERVTRRVAPQLVAVRVSQPAAARPRRLADLLEGPSSASNGAYYPAVHLDGERALVATAVRGDLGVSTARPGEPRPAVLAVDPLQRASVLAMPGGTATPPSTHLLGELPTPTYVVVAEGTAAGVTFRPVFLGSASQFTDPRWSRPLLAVSGVNLTSPGALVFTLEGQFLGAALAHNGGLAIVSAADLVALADQLTHRGRTELTDLGLGVHDLTPSLADALRTPQGVVVSEVADTGPAAGRIQPADVITAIDGTPVTTADQALLRLALADLPVELTIVRDGRVERVTIDNTTSRANASSPPSGGEMKLEYVKNLGSVVRALDETHPAARAGVRIDDVIVRAGDQVAPTPAQLAAHFGAAGPEPLVLIVRREGRDRVLAITRPNHP